MRRLTPLLLLVLTACTGTEPRACHWRYTAFEVRFTAGDTVAAVVPRDSVRECAKLEYWQ